jgi:hypothetical protein
MIFLSSFDPLKNFVEENRLLVSTRTQHPFKQQKTT